MTEYNIENSITEKNLQISFINESQARNKYTFFASIAKKDGFIQIANIFTATANNEKEHAELFYKYLQGRDVKVNFTFSSGIGDTLQNLKLAASGEHYEWSELYKRFAKVAKEEGFEEISDTFGKVAEVEKFHDRRYCTLIKNIEEMLVFKREEPVNWVCSNCGYVIHDKEAPEVCPCCKHARAYFEILCENY